MYLFRLNVFTLFSQAIQFGQLMEYNAINIFLQKIMRKMRQGD